MIDIRVEKKLGSFSLNTAFESDSDGTTALFGRSGAGKTSIINMIAGLVQPDAGCIRINDLTLFDSARRINLAPEKRRIGYVFQDGRLFPHLSVKKNLTYGLRLTRKKFRYIGIDEVVDLLGIDHLMSRYPSALSGGEKQRVAIGRALLTSPSLLLMDEPLASLDETRKKDVLPFIARLSSRFSIPIIYVSHSLDEILNLADHLVLLSNGNVVACGNIESIVNRIDLAPYIGGSDYGSVISGIVDVCEDNYGLTHLKFAGGIIKVPHLFINTGSPVRIRIPARSVSISLSRPVDTSIQNVFPGTIEEILSPDPSFVDIRMDIGCPLVARITRQSKESLGLKTGTPVFALVKSIAVTNDQGNSNTFMPQYSPNSPLPGEYCA